MDSYATKIYVKAARGRNGPKVAAGSRPSYTPLTEMRDGRETDLPTAMFALELQIPESVLRQAENVAASVVLDDANSEGVVVRPLQEGRYHP